MSVNTIEDGLKEQVEEIIKCPICLENFHDPRMLPCSHTFCLKCIKDLAANNHGEFKCPLRDGIKIANKNIDSLPINLVVRDIADLVSKNSGTTNCCNCEAQIATLWCRDCLNKGFCQECYQNLHRLPALSDHRSSESKPPKIVTCSDHPTKEVEFWCKENKTPHCSICLVTKQQQHKCELINDAVKEITNRVINSFIRHPFSTNPEIILNEMLMKYEEKSSLKKSTVADIFASLRQMIDDREKFIYEKLSDTHVQNKKKIEEYHIEFMNKYKSLRERYVLFNQLVATGDHITVLRDYLTYEQYLARMTEEWSNLKHPTLIEFNIDGLDKLKTTMAQSLENVRLVEQLPYENPQLEQLISQQQADSTLNLNNQGLNDFDTIIIARALRTNTKIVTLYLGNNQIKAAGAKRIAEALQFNKTLATLDLWSNQIGATGAQYFADVLRNNMALIELGLNANDIDNKGAQYFADALRQNKTLTKLYLVGNQIGNEGAQNLAEMLKNNTTLKELHILQNKEISTTVRAQLENQDKRLR